MFTLSSRSHVALILGCLLASSLACSSDPPGQPIGDGSANGAASSLDDPAGGDGNVAMGAGGSDGSDGSQVIGAGGTSAPSLGGTRAEVQAACDSQLALNLGVTKLRRLTKSNLNRAIMDLFGADYVDYAGGLAPDEKVGPFYSNSIAPVTDLIVQQLSEVAALVAFDALSMTTRFLPCDLEADTSTDCAAEFIESFGARVYRRPVTAAEASELLDLYILGRDGTSSERGLELLLRAFLQSGSFLYLVDTGLSGEPLAVPELATAHTLASRLSFFLWDTIPDAELQAAADDGTLADDAVYAGQVARMLADPKAASAVALFHEQWLDVSDLPGKKKDSERFPDYGIELALDMLDDQAKYVSDVILNGDALLSTLFSSATAYPSPALADIYGVEAPSVSGEKMELSAEQRGGLLTQPAFLAAHARSLESSPVHRGIIVRENILCEIIPPPPAGVSTDLPEKTPATTTREQFAQHLENPTCAACHRLIDPIGLAFEHYDAIGAWRQLDGSAEIDATGEVLESGDDVAGVFDGVMELSSRLAGSRAVSDCLARQWFRFALSRVESESDACSMLSLFESFEASGANVKTLLTDIALSQAFRNVRLTGGGEQ